MNEFDASNKYFQRALQFVNQTGRNIFLTGKAGTGKTTFLRHIKEHSHKKTAIVAPTGVAAINAGGTTLHSFFQLPFGPYLPSLKSTGVAVAATNEHTLFKNLRFNTEKRELLQELELLVIDEVSMLRADMLDAVDTILRHFRKQPLLPFGGLQVLFIGDLFQLPPVIKNEEWEILRSVYKSPFFFDALAVHQAPPVYLELKKIYRQNEAEFISILNNIRNNKATDTDLKKLHQHYKPGFEPLPEDNYITLTTHNMRADAINRQELEKLPGEIHDFEGEFKGDFNERALPAERTVRLKEGAQIMFIKNDKGEFRRYYNGKLGIVSRINQEEIFVTFPGEEELLIEKETWKNIRYNYHKERDIIEEEELGTFTQYPIRLAWAITIHKSQGLTFEKAIIDAGASFAPGQVYVALSRLTSLEGMILYSRIQPQSIQTDERVLEFARSEITEDALAEALEQEQKLYLSHSLSHAFNFAKITQRINQHYDDYANRQIPDKNAAIAWALEFVNKIEAQKETAEKFDRQLSTLLQGTDESKYEKIYDRVSAAQGYFDKALEEMCMALQQHVKEMNVKQRMKKYIKELLSLQLDITRQKQLLQHALLISNGLKNGTALTDLLTLAEQQRTNTKMEEDIQVAEIKLSAPKKGDTKRISLTMFKEGNSIRAIADTRGMTTGTIEGHLAHFIPTGEINITDIVAENKIEPIQKAIALVGGNSTSPVKEQLGDGFSHNEIRIVMAHMRTAVQAK